MNQFHILLTDDEAPQREAIAGFLRKKGFKISEAEDGKTAIEKIRAENLDMVITDFKMPDITGEQVLKQAMEINPMLPVVVMTAYGSVESAVEIMKSGAYDYIQKPLQLDELLIIINRARERSLLISENAMLRSHISEKYSFKSIISQSGEMESVINIAGRVAQSKASVLIRGESGTGKELIARAIHLASARAEKPFVVVNCAAMPETLFESELFGHEKGSFTGAQAARIGKFEQADTGTLFIDEVGDIPAAIQVKLLRAVQFGEIQRLGSNITLNPDVRIITATNRNLEQLIKSGEFREDLYYRFNVVEIKIPPLRARRLDIQPLTEYFIKKYSIQNEKLVKSASKEVFNVLTKYDFPGNVRELENLVQRAVVLARNEYLTIEDFPEYIRFASNTEAVEFSEIQIGDLNKTIEKVEGEMIKKALKATNGNQSKAAELLNISERTLRYKISKSEINTD